MKRYKFCFKKSKERESLGYHDAYSLEEATSYFCKIKNLSMFEFLNLFTVLEA